MIRNIFLLMVVSVFLAGCTTTREPSQLSQLEIKVAQLERRVKDRDEEIEQLKYDVKDLSAQYDGVESQQPVQEYYPPAKSMGSGAPVVSSGSPDEIIRVPVAAQDAQQALKAAGYYDGAVDGKIGSKTKEAIKNFQQAHNLTADGIIGKRTWEELKLYLQ